MTHVMILFLVTTIQFGVCIRYDGQEYHQNTKDTSSVNVVPIDQTRQQNCNCLSEGHNDDENHWSCWL